MKRVLAIPIIALSLAYAGLLAFHSPPYKGGDKEDVSVSGAPTSGYTSSTTDSSLSPIDADKFLVPELYEPAWIMSVKTTPCKQYRGAMINHHALASDLIAQMMRELARCRPSTKLVIILSPDHYNAGSSQVTTHRISYRTAGDVVRVDMDSLERLKASLPEAGESPELFEHEHGVGVLVPFMHRALPQAQIVPIVIKSSIGEMERNELADWLKSEAATGAFIIVSSDMSHYLDEATAKQNDERTKRALVDSEMGFFVRAKDDYTDNGPSIAAVIQALKPRRWNLVAQAISSDYAGSSGFTTTYLVGFWD